MGNCLRTTHHLLGYRRHQEQRAPSLYCKRLDAQLDRYLIHLFQDHNFFLSVPATGHSHAASIQHDLATSSFVLLVPPVFSPSSDANEGIDLLAISSSNGLTLRLPQTNQVQKGESTKSRVMKGY